MPERLLLISSLQLFHAPVLLLSCSRNFGKKELHSPSCHSSTSGASALSIAHPAGHSLGKTSGSEKLYFPSCPSATSGFSVHSALHIAMLRGILAPSPGLLGRGFPGLPLLAAPSRGRKSRHDPPAKSKAGRINRPPPVDPAELLVVQERYRQYDRILQSLRAEFKYVVMKRHYEERFGMLGTQRKEVAEEEHRQLMALNDAENQRLQQLREERLRREEAEEKEQRLHRAQNHASFLEEFLKEKEKEVIQLQDDAKHFITPDNLDEKIEECLNNPQNYNFAVDKEGRVVKRSSLP